MSENISDPDIISVSISNDGTAFKDIKEEKITVKKEKETSISKHKLRFEPVSARFVKVKAQTPVLVTSPYMSWLFVSEIGIF